MRLLTLRARRRDVYRDTGLGDYFRKKNRNKIEKRGKTPRARLKRYSLLNYEAERTVLIFASIPFFGTVTSVLDTQVISPLNARPHLHYK